MNEKGMTLMELIVVIALMTVVIAGASTVQLFTNKMVVERSITTDQRQIVEMIKDDIINTLMYAESVALSNEDEVLSEETYKHVVGYEENKGYMKDKEEVFAPVVYNGNHIAISFQYEKHHLISCTIEVSEKGGITLKDTFLIKLLNVKGKNDETIDKEMKFKYVYYS